MPNKLFTVFKNRNKEFINIKFEVDNINKEKDCFIELYVLPENYKNCSKHLFHRGPISKRTDNKLILNNLRLKLNESIGIIISHNEVKIRIIENNTSTIIEEFS